MATNKDIEFLQQLNLDFESFKNSPFNMLKPFKIPKKLKTLMVEATEEEIYNTVLYSVYNACNSLINNVINIVKMKLENKADKFKECVGSERVELLSKAIFHEINYRFTTATTPELFNKLSVASNNIQVLGTPRDFYLAEQHLNPIARNFLEDGEWNLLGVELGKAYEKAIELDKKLEEFKEVLSKEITEAKNEANSIFKVLKTDYETRADDLYYKKWGKLTTLSESLVDKVTKAREEQEALLETNYKRLKNNADVNYDFYLNKIKEIQKTAKDNVSKIIEESKTEITKLANQNNNDLENKFTKLQEELGNKFFKIPHGPAEETEFKRNIGFTSLQSDFQDGLYVIRNTIDKNSSCLHEKLFWSKQNNRRSKSSNFKNKWNIRKKNVSNANGSSESVEIIEKKFSVDDNLKQGQSSFITIPISANLIITELWSNSNGEQAPLMVPITLPKMYKSPMPETIIFWACDPQMNNEAGLFELSYSHWLDKATTEYHFALHTFKKLGGTLKIETQDFLIELTGQAANMD
ncbi:hypothetical protein ACXYFN_02190 [Mycoplasma sp. 48589B]